MRTLGRTESGGSQKTHWMGESCGVKSAILRCRRRYFGGLEQRLPGALVRHAVELLKRLVFGWDELPHIKRPPLARKNLADKHDLDHVDKLDLLVLHNLDAVLESGQLRKRTPG